MTSPHCHHVILPPTGGTYVWDADNFPCYITPWTPVCPNHAIVPHLLCLILTIWICSWVGFNGSFPISISSLGVWKPTLTKMTFLIGSRSQHLCSVDDHDGTRMTLPLMHITRTAVSWPPAAARSTHVNDNDARIKSAQSWSRGSTYGSPSASAAAASLLMAPDLSCSCQRPRASQLLPATMLVFIPIIFSNARLILNPTFWRLFCTFFVLSGLRRKTWTQGRSCYVNLINRAERILTYSKNWIKKKIKPKYFLYFTPLVC